MLDIFQAFAILTPDEVAVLQDWVTGKSITQTTMVRSMSPSTVNRIRKRIRTKYDAVQPYTGLPRRRM